MSNQLEITAFMHCARCLQEKPDEVSPQKWSRLDVGWTPRGLQVWCRRHEINVCHIDFEGMTHPADVSIGIVPRKKPPAP